MYEDANVGVDRRNDEWLSALKSESARKPKAYEELMEIRNREKVDALNKQLDEDDMIVSMIGSTDYGPGQSLSKSSLDYINRSRGFSGTNENPVPGQIANAGYNANGDYQFDIYKKGPDGTIGVSSRVMPKKEVYGIMRHYADSGIASFTPETIKDLEDELGKDDASYKVQSKLDAIVAAYGQRRRGIEDSIGRARSMIGGGKHGANGGSSVESASIRADAMRDVANIKANSAVTVEKLKNQGRLDVTKLTFKEKKELAEAANIIKKYGYDIGLQIAQGHDAASRANTQDRVAAQKEIGAGHDAASRANTQDRVAAQKEIGAGHDAASRANTQDRVAAQKAVGAGHDAASRANTQDRVAAQKEIASLVEAGRHARAVMIDDIEWEKLANELLKIDKDFSLKMLNAKTAGRRFDVLEDQIKKNYEVEMKRATADEEYKRRMASVAEGNIDLGWFKAENEFDHGQQKIDNQAEQAKEKITSQEKMMAQKKEMMENVAKIRAGILKFENSSEAEIMKMTAKDKENYNKNLRVIYGNTARLLAAIDPMLNPTEAKKYSDELKVLNGKMLAIEKSVGGGTDKPAPGPVKPAGGGNGKGAGGGNGSNGSPSEETITENGVDYVIRNVKGKKFKARKDSNLNDRKSWVEVR